MAAVLNLNVWNGVIPVLLPWGQPTISSIGVASAGVAVPFFIYAVAMFMTVVPIWMQNFESDKQAGKSLPLQSAVNQSDGRVSISVNGGLDNNNNSYLLQAEQDYPSDFRLRPQF